LSRIKFLPYENLTKTTPLTGGNERSFVRKDEDNCRKKNGSPTLEKRIRRKGRRNLSKLQKKKRERKGEKGIKKEDDGLIML